MPPKTLDELDQMLMHDLEQIRRQQGPLGRLRWRHRNLPQIHTGEWVSLKAAQRMADDCRRIYGEYITYVVEIQ